MQLLRPALLLAPSYFCLNYTYFFSLDLTSVSSTMILSASTGVWTLFFSRLLLGEPLTRLKLATVAVSLVGMSLVTVSAHGSSRWACSHVHRGARACVYLRVWGVGGSIYMLWFTCAACEHVAHHRLCTPPSQL